MDTIYTILLATHSWLRWIVVVSLVYAIVRGLRGWIRHVPFDKSDGVARMAASIAVRVQFGVGFILYFISPITTYFIGNFHEGLTIPDVAFFGLMHVGSMVVAIALISIGEARSKKAADDQKKFSRMTVFYLLGFILLYAATPWPYFANVGRPLFRGF